MSEPRMYPVEEAVKARKALRAASGLGPEMFPIQAFVGMISDEIESLRKPGKRYRPRSVSIMASETRILCFQRPAKVIPWPKSEKMAPIDWGHA